MDLWQCHFQLTYKVPIDYSGTATQWPSTIFIHSSNFTNIICVYLLTIVQWNTFPKHVVCLPTIDLFKEVAGRLQRLTLNAPITTTVVCFSRLLKCLRSHYGKQCGPRSDFTYRSSLFWVRTVCFYTLFVSNVRQFLAAEAFSRRHFQMHFFLAL